MTATTLHRQHDTINNNELAHVVIDDEPLSDYALNEIKEARREIKRGEFYTEKEIKAMFGL
ncbi:MAG: hypothetical protein Q7J10_00745 [Methanosarcinaceae archaeon]|nr:hypothetical protein [Methanosarcinaceae archaeon]